MKKTLLTLCLLAALLPLNAQERHWDSLRVNGNMRQFEVYIPANAKRQAPLVMVLHGYGNYGGIIPQLLKAADRHAFVICAPVGLKDLRGKPGWNVGYPGQIGWKVNDVADLCQVARYMQQRYDLSRVNTFLTGMSNGGDMCYMMGYQGQDVFRAVASVAGQTMEWAYKTSPAPKPIPLMEIHGTADHVSDWNGDATGAGGWGVYLSVPMGVNYWVVRDRCTREIRDTIPSINKQSDHYFIRHRYEGGTDGCEVWLYENVGSGHGWQDRDIDVGETIWTFFRKYFKP